ncbi:MAG TPA: substrate-binding domain-containing protein [Polyangiaceae bacterium]|jgi:molybdate-binding protein/DNA-binding XRE family transcriptional regulator
MQNRVRKRRLAASLTQGELAARSEISRQALHAIESNRSSPSVEVALAIARSLSTTVDALFADDARRSARLAASATGRVALAWMRGRWVAHALGARDVAADAIADGRRATLLRDESELRENVIVMGCAPVLGALCDRLNGERAGARCVWLPRDSTRALEALRDGETHVAGSHLVDRRSGEMNVEASRLAPRCALVTLAHWEVGLLVAKGNPLRIRRAADVTRRGTRLVTREKGSGARRMLDRALAAEGASGALATAVATSHGDVARAIALGAFDVGPGVRETALTHDLDFVPLGVERFDLAVGAPDDPRVSRLLDAVTRADVRREMRALGYDTQQSGTRVAA